MGPIHTITHTKNSGGHPVHLFLAKGAEEVALAGRYAHRDVATPTPPWNHEVVFAHNGPRIYAALGFYRKSWCRTIETGWAYTDISFRGQGLNTSLILWLEKFALANGYRRICRITHSDNVPAQRAMEGAGYESCEVMYQKVLGMPDDFAEWPELKE